VIHLGRSRRLVHTGCLDHSHDTGPSSARPVIAPSPPHRPCTGTSRS
jgi:hypothetical protein